MQTPRLAVLAIALGSAVTLAACSSGSSSSDASATASASESASASPSPSGTSEYVPLTAPPTGATELSRSDSADAHYARYSIEGQNPQQVVSYYTNAWQGDGYTVDSAGGGGGGWGQYGGSGAGATGSKSGSYVAVQAGGQNGSTTYFEVCEGTSEQAVQNCGNDDNQNDNQNQNQNDN